MPVFFSFQQVREDLAKHTQGITQDQLWLEMAGKHSVGYHLKHIAGSVDRLTAYLLVGQLSPEQLDFLRNEHTSGDELSVLLARVHESLHAAELQLLKVKPESLFESRAVGRQLLPTTVIGLIVHVCEHTQRHLGQAILLAKVLRQV
jgi:uncharacterized damage-inducible protein DinB